MEQNQIQGFRFNTQANSNLFLNEWNDTNETIVISRWRSKTGLNLPEYWHENPEFDFVPLCRFIRVSFHPLRSIIAYA